MPLFLRRSAKYLGKVPCFFASNSSVMRRVFSEYEPNIVSVARVIRDSIWLPRLLTEKNKNKIIAKKLPTAKMSGENFLIF